MKKDLLTLNDLSVEDIGEIFKLAEEVKKKPFSRKGALKDAVVALIFQKPSTRTRVSFEVGTVQLGGTPIYLGPDDIMLGAREPIKDMARVLSRYIQLAVLRTFRHEDIEEFSGYASMPVINGLSDLFHPCQALADIFTMREKLGALKGRTLCFIGDGNNVLHSLLHCAARTSVNMMVATPKGYEPDAKVLKAAFATAAKTGARILIGNDPVEAVKGADIIYTDVWVSMGQESERSAKIKAFKGFRVTADLVRQSGGKALVMHCLPAHRGEEITDDVIDGKNSIVFDQAENRLHVQKAVMIKLMSQVKTRR
ncbi:MAG: ornithine carbamoyltransferase [Candidatus Omnitrophota bacterium]